MIPYFFVNYIHVNQILHWLKASSNLKVNLNKSELISIGEIPRVEELAFMLGCGVGKLLVTYLGLPFGARFKILIETTTTWLSHIWRNHIHYESYHWWYSEFTRCWLAMEGSLVINKKKFIMIPITKFGILLNQEGNWLT